MSKGSKRRSYKKALADHRAVFSDLEKEPEPAPAKKAWLTMSDEEIDRVYWNVGKADRTRMKKGSATERQREKIRAIMAAELAAESEN